MHLIVNGARLFFDVVGAKLAPRGPRMIERPTVLMLHGGPLRPARSARPGALPRRW
jgi:hypothetical protein